ncbi:MAG: hypothetical protein LBL96_01120 [Clostridiales bacterium]|nr:hypothetical protein [Clostridiales bacterium]
MEMIQTYQGYFVEDGRFVPDNFLIKIPIKRRAIVNILEDEVPDTNDVGVTQDKADIQQKAAAIKAILEDALKVENSVLSDADWDEMSSLRVQTNAGLSRAVEL